MMALQDSAMTLFEHDQSRMVKTNKMNALSETKNLDLSLDRSRVVLAEFAVTRADIGTFREVKTSARAKDYCLCLFEQDLSDEMTAWLCLACGPALELPQRWIKSIDYTPLTRRLHILIHDSPFETLSWRSSRADPSTCPDPTHGELDRVRSIDVHLSRLVDPRTVDSIISKIRFPVPATLPSSQSTEFSPSLSPVGTLSPSFSDDTLWMSSGGVTPDRFYRPFQSDGDDPDESLDEDHHPNTASPRTRINSRRSSFKGRSFSPKPMICPQSSPSQSTHDLLAILNSHPDQNKSWNHHYRSGVCPTAEDSAHHPKGSEGLVSRQTQDGTGQFRHQHQLLVQRLQEKVDTRPSSSTSCHAEEKQDSQDKVCEGSGMEASSRQRCASASQLEGLMLSLPKSGIHSWADIADTSAPRRQSCDGLLETYTDSLIQPKSPVQEIEKVKNTYKTKQSALTITTDFPLKDSLRDTSMSSVSDAGGDRRASIASTISDISVCLSHTTLSSGSSSSSVTSVPRKGGPPVHYTLMCWIGGRWPCKLRPLIKKSNLQDIHTTLRRNLKLPSNYFIDIEFQWEGTTYMILDATHWQWAREQVQHGDMSIRCNIWQKKYAR